jgi:hypothetical protein
MPYRRCVVVGVEAVRDVVLSNTRYVGDETPHGHDGGVKAMHGRVDLRPVAGGEDHGLVDRLVVEQLTERLGQGIRSERHLFEHRKRDGFVRKAADDDRHWG